MQFGEKSKATKATAIMSHAFALGETLGVPPREMARAALTAAIAFAEASDDPDGMLSQLMALHAKRTK